MGHGSVPVPETDSAGASVVSTDLPGEDNGVPKLLEVQHLSDVQSFLGVQAVLLKDYLAMPPMMRVYLSRSQSSFCLKGHQGERSTGKFTTPVQQIYSIATRRRKLLLLIR